MEKQKHIPLRKCMGCNTSFDKRDLVRVVRTPENTVVYDETGKMNGRGAYLCKNAKCFANVRKSGRLSRVLNVGIPDEVYDTLAQLMQGGDSHDGR